MFSRIFCTTFIFVSKIRRFVVTKLVKLPYKFVITYDFAIRDWFSGWEQFLQKMSMEVIRKKKRT